MSDDQILIRWEVLEPVVADLFAAAGLTAADAAFYAEALINTNLWGIDSHGVLRLPVYVERLRKRAMNPRPQTRIIRSSFAFEVMDGDDGPGPIVGRDAMNRAIALAEQYSVGLVGAIRSNHFGAAGIYTRMAAARGMIGIAMTNVIPIVVAPGGAEPVVGNNPIAIGFPTFGEFPFVLDISLSAVARGKLLLASKKGEKIPLDWATDRQGRPTDDPDEAFEGFLLPMAGHKGLALAYIVDMFCGVITGGVFLDEIKSMYTHPDEPSVTSHMMIAINPAAVMPPDEMKARMAAFYRKVKDSPMSAEDKEMLLPGEIEYRTALARRKDGIPVPPKLYRELTALGRELGVSRPLTEI